MGLGTDIICANQNLTPVVINQLHMGDWPKLFFKKSWQ